MTLHHLSNAVDDMAGFFESSVETNGVTIDPVLCGVFAEALRELQKTLRSCERYLAAQAAIEKALSANRPRPSGTSSNVIRFTLRRPSSRQADGDGGDAA